MRKGHGNRKDRNHSEGSHEPTDEPHQSRAPLVHKTFHVKPEWAMVALTAVLAIATIVYCSFTWASGALQEKPPKLQRTLLRVLRTS